MSNNKMLIDATHPEETRVVVLRNGRVEEFDYESAARKLLRGNIYLAKVTRVEPSLQAAFVDYGGNRHGFLAFNEIHPDYYQIPMADRQALLDEEAAEEAREEAEADARAERLARRQRHQRHAAPAGEDRGPTAEGSEPLDDEGSPRGDDYDDSRSMAEATGIVEEVTSEPMAQPEDVGSYEPQPDSDDATGTEDEATGGDVAGEEAQSTSAEEFRSDDGGSEAAGDASSGPDALAEPETERDAAQSNGSEAESVEQTGAEDALEELPSRPRRHRRSYKIQEVIKRRQVILVQVVKEERGNKGAALTTYLSLAGRYTVLMPNTARGGGISRKITNPQDRKRLKAIAGELDVPEGMGLIIRTAGAARTKQEIKRDFEYLLRLWESVRDLTLASSAPSLVYEEGNLIKRSIRDLYNKDVEEIIVAGEHAHHEARDFMRMLMPSHTKNVLHHQESEPLFTRYGIERQLNAMFSPYVTLKSGGYLVINQTEALVAVDVNSGKATREFSIEETALNTNLEAADEIARQLKLRDLAGLIVIDFIDMEEKRNNRAVERRLKDALRFDRARIQLGHISHFGLMEMSRQRLRTGVLEGSTSQCPHCQGTGIIRSTESVALAVLRGLEDALLAGSRVSLVATTTVPVALYILNYKRHFINDMEARYEISVTVQSSDKLQGANFTIDKSHAPAPQGRRQERSAVNMDWGFEGASEQDDAVEEEGEPSRTAPEQREIDDRGERDGSGEEGGRGRRRRRGRRGRERDRGERGDRGHHERRSHGGPQGEGRTDAFRDDAQPAAGADVEVQPAGYGDQPELIEMATRNDEGISEAEVSGDGGADERDGRAGDEGGRGRRRRGRRGGRRGRDRDRPALGASREEDDYPSPVMSDAPSTDGEPLDHAPESENPMQVTADAKREVRPARPARHERAAEIAVDAPAPSELRAERDSERAAPAAAEQPRVEPKPTSQRRGRGEPSSSEPKIERVVVKPDQATPDATPDASAPSDGSETASSTPARKGWWSRTLGSA